MRHVSAPPAQVSCHIRAACGGVDGALGQGLVGPAVFFSAIGKGPSIWSG